MRYVYLWNPAADLSVRVHDWLCARREPPLFCVSDQPTLDKLNDLLPEQGPVLGVNVLFPYPIGLNTLKLFDPFVVQLVVTVTTTFPPTRPGGMVSLQRMDGGLLAHDLVPLNPETASTRLDTAAFQLFTDHWEYLLEIPEWK